MTSSPPPSSSPPSNTSRPSSSARWLERSARILTLVALLLVASHFALRFGSGGLWRGLGAAHAVAGDAPPAQKYDLTRLSAVTETLKKIRDKYVDPERIKPREMFLSALNAVQKEVAQVIVLHDEGSPSVRVRVDTEERSFRVDSIQGPWDVAARLREVFEFLQANLAGTEVKLDEVEYAACNGILETLDPHSVFLSPEAYGEMNLSTSGHFGGLGIVISIRDQMLTVMRPMPGTPAGRAELMRLDRITKINNESTLNMPLDDAVERLRGKPGSKVTIWIHRDGKGGWRDSKPFVLTREVIRIKSVESRELAAGIGYVRLKQFQASTDDELAEALEGLRKKGPLQGLVLDLRGNPGGLLDQAARVADRFLARGVIVATVGNSEGREEKQAQKNGTEPNYPILLITDGNSASASEIVAGALKNHDRALIMGQTTFGKGSVQLVFSNVSGAAALKLTIAQYLTPGDISIQGVGVTPDIELDPMTADTMEMDLFRSERRFSESELEKSLTHQSARSAERPAVTLRYNFPESERAEWREQGGQVPDEFYLDFPIRFARDLVGKMAAGKPRQQQLLEVKPFIEAEQQSQLAAVSKDLAALSIAWTTPPANVKDGARADQLAVKVATDRPGNRVAAGEAMKLVVGVTNNGDRPVYQLRAITKSDAGYYDERELIFGSVNPGQTVHAEVPLGFCRIRGRKAGTSEPLPLDATRECTLPLDAVTREDVIRVRFDATVGEPPPDAEIRVAVESLPKPSFAYTYQVSDTTGNGDGQVQLGESVTIYLDVQNTGLGTSRETQALLRNVTGDGLLLRAGRFDISEMKPGDQRQVAFTFDVLNNLTENAAKVELSIVDRDLRVAASEKVLIPIVTGGLFVKPANGEAELVRRAELRPQPVPGAVVFGALATGSVVRTLGQFGEFAKIGLDGDRFAFVENDALKQGKKGVALKFEPLMTHSPPLLTVGTTALATRDATVKLSGSAKDSDQVLDVYIFVGAQKVFYQSNRKGTNPKELQFQHEVALQPGINVINVVARESEEVATGYSLVVRRDGPNGETLPTPKGQSFAEDWSFSAPE